MKGEGERRLVGMHEWTAFGHQPFVSGVITAEVISEIFVTLWAVTFWTKK
jgi:hypothetical protein